MKELVFSCFVLTVGVFGMNRGESIDKSLSSFSRRDATMMSYLDKKYPESSRTLEQQLAIADAYMQLCEDKESGIAHLASIRLLALRKGVLLICQNRADEMVPGIIIELKQQISF